MNLLLADPPALGTEEQPLSGPPVVPPVSPEGADAAAVNGAGADDAAVLAVPSAERTCAHCGTPLHPAQAWCLHCGAPLASALAPPSPRGPLRALAIAAAVLAAGAAVAGAAVLTRHHPARRLPSLALVRPGVPAGALPTTPPAGAPGKTGPLGPKKLLFPPSSAAKPPKIPAATPTPKSSGGSGVSEAGGLGETGGGSEEGSGETGGSSKETGSESNGSSKEGSNEGAKETGSESGSSKEGSKENGSSPSSKPSPILLDTNAASSYNPYNYPSSSFGDPALAIDGEPSTPWTAAVQPASFPKMAEGLLIDLRTPTAVGSVELVVPRTSIGMTVEIFAAAKHPPATITARGWTLLSKAHVLKKKTTLLHLRATGKKFGYVNIWIPKVSAASRGTVAAPGFVSLSEVSLFPR